MSQSWSQYMREQAFLALGRATIEAVDEWRTRFDDPPPSAAEVTTAALARIVNADGGDGALVNDNDKLAMFTVGVLSFGRETHDRQPGQIELKFRLLIWREQNV